jgi:Gluconate 2-dehydrogenase subunit 3
MADSAPSSKTFPLIAAGSPQPDGIARRAVLQALLGTVGAGLALPADAAAAQHPMLHHLENGAQLDQAQARAAAEDYAPVLLDAHQLRTLEALAEAIVPGSTIAKVAPFLDQLIAVESGATQRAFLGALGAFDMAAIQKHTKPWLSLAANEQQSLLQEASTADPAASALRRHFQILKDWIAGAYYTSEPGMRELGWTGGVFHAAFPGCTHPDGHAK